MDVGEGFGELEEGVPDEGFGDVVSLAGAGVVVFPEGDKVPAVAVVEVELGLEGVDEGGAEVYYAGVVGESVAEEMEFGLRGSVVFCVGDYFADYEGASAAGFEEVGGALAAGTEVFDGDVGVLVV